MRTALILMALAVSAVPAFAQDADKAARAYEVCLFGNYVVEARGGVPSGDAFWKASELCQDLAALVPESYGDPEGEGSTGAAAVEESVIHFVDGVLSEVF
jgi:hypothetical protein